LWSGVVAEDGIDGVRIDEPHAALQRVLVEQNDSGRLVCLLSKNEVSDVRGLFENHPEMPLRWSNLVAYRVDWNPKPDSLRSVMSELELGLDSVVFLDDNPVECAEMRACCPAVTTVRVPTDPVQLASFADHLWLLDQPKVTAEDRNRTKMYRENASRAELRRGTDSLQSFLDGLELVVEIAPVSPAEVPRIAQLSQRTNQFNTSLIRCDEAGVRQGLTTGGVFHRFVRARDRFGDYGIVGQVRARTQGSCLEVDLFMLSCRALGRGIEHQMLAAAGEHAISQGLDEVAVLFRRGDRNAPAKRFLEGVFKIQAQSDEQWFGLSARLAADLVFDTSVTGAESDVPEQAEQRRAQASAERPDVGARYEHIAHMLTSGAQIERAMASRGRPRPDLASGFVAPAAGPEREIASIWQEVLRIKSVGIHDRFQDLGGKSIHLVQVHRLLLDRLKMEVDITTLFQHATVSLLAAHLSARSHGNVTAAAQVRGSKMREARARAADRYGAAR
jgi:FkbH-like protein